MRGILRDGLIVLSIAFIVFSVFFINEINRATALTTVNGTESRLTIWDQTDSATKKSGDNVYFYGNFTNLTSSESINGTGIYCEIEFNYNGSWTSPDNMTFNGSSSLYYYSRTFNYKNNHTYNITCYGSSAGYDYLEASENFTVTNTKPSITDTLPDIHCYEDDTELCVYNFSANVTDPDLNDVLSYGIDQDTLFDNLTINNNTGIATVNCTTDNCAITNCTLGNCDGNFYPLFLVTDDSGRGENAEIAYCMYAVNDVPVFSPMLQNMTVYQSDVFYYDANATDEENNLPFNFTLNITWCYRPYTSNTSCNVFSMNSSTGIIDRGRNFTNDEVGVYVINFTVTDNGTIVEPYNASSSVLINITVLNVNEPPNITTNLTEQIIYQNQSFYLEVNATDPENDTVTFSATTLYRNLSTYINSTLFQFNLTNYTMYENISVGIMNYTIVSNYQVGNFTMNITADDGNINGTTWKLVNFTVYNINDPPVLDTVGNHTAVQDVNFLLQVNASDIDDFPSYIPYNDIVNGTLTYNLSFLQGIPFFDIDNETGLVNFTANSSQTGNYSLNITVTDGGNITDWEVINITVVPNNPPNITTNITAQTTTQNQSFYLEFNGTDPDNATQNITFFSQTYYRNMTLISTNKFPVTSIDNSSWPASPVLGIMNYTPVNNSQVGNYTVRIILMDNWNVTDYIDVNFTVYNINDAPVMINITSPQESYEDTEYYFDVNVTDVDFETPYGENITYNITFLNGTSFFGIDNETGIIDYTITNNSCEGNYTVNITAWDSENITTWQVVNFTHRAINDYPQFQNLNLTLEARSLEEFYYDVNATDEETSNSSLFYNITFVNGTQFFNITNDTGEINFTVNDSYIGSYLINFTVTDDGYNSSFQGFLTNRTNTTQVVLNVLSANYPPQITEWGLSPYQDPDNVTLQENGSVEIHVSISDLNNDSLTCYWYVDDIQNGDESEITPGACSYGNPGALARYKPTFQDSGNRTIRFVVSDGNATDTFNFTVNVTNLNRPPQLVYLIGKQVWPMNTENENINLSYHFVDPDNTNSVTNDDNIMQYSINITPSHITVTINQTSGQVTLTPDTNWYGETTTRFVANDSEYAINSSIVDLEVQYVETETITVTSSGGSTSTTTNTVTVTETKIASLTIEAEPMIEVKRFEELKTPLKFINTGEVDLSDISISAIDVDRTGEVELQLKNRNINELLTEESFTTDLRIITKNLTRERYQIKITGDVYDPELEQSTTIHLRTLPINKTIIEEQIRLVKDLFEENPPCMELMELIISAERELGKGNLGKAENLTQLALDNCRDLILYTANMTYSRPGYIEANRIPGNLIIVSVILAVSVVIIATAHYITEERRKKKEREEFLKRRREERIKHQPKL